ncbi:metal ABC transporter solute-binding protein, Zn/Mn family [Aerococcus kribbianus]|uniref:Zinc ABC transporter substrate-binding protein n=1 Tax=Aerococcus kribbianus TaxID=2999064 RepID=A0A9X3FMB6_9LACT|nr:MULTISPECIES: zinc ABC transporter substrate-binding protein [unclassified Aerococcus]MCZ0716874.1 zinc ABC transporter substrate-binding protein [Aerococcus sp. YH-aer221]MCZ0725162.1 zinc ABC transporter substrate-binding protein [Aerococcus sp. YH-aer222]
MTKIMKYICRGLLLAMAAFLLVACGQTGGQKANDSNSKLQVVATTTQVDDLMKQIGGDHVEVQGLMGPGVDPHGYEPSPSDTKALQNADVVAYSGFHLEAMFTDLLESLGKEGKATINMSDAVKDSQALASKEEGLTHDPHIWFSVSIWRQAAQHAADQLSEIDPDHKDDYQANAKEYIAKLDDLDDYISQRIEEIPEQSRYLVTAHDAFNYFGQEYDFEVVGIQGLNSQTEAGTGDISQVADLMADNNVKAVFVESSVSDRNVNALLEAASARGHSAEIGGELYSDSLGSDDEGTDTYIAMYKHNVDTIVDALK